MLAEASRNSITEKEIKKVFLLSKRMAKEKLRVQSIKRRREGKPPEAHPSVIKSDNNWCSNVTYFGSFFFCRFSLNKIQFEANETKEI